MADSGRVATVDRPGERPDRVVVDSSAEAMLDDVTRPLVREALALLDRHARQQRVAVDHVDIRGHTSWEEGDEQIVIAQWVRLPLEESLAYWDTLEAPIQAWEATLSADELEALYRRVSIRVQHVRVSAGV